MTREAIPSTQFDRSGPNDSKGLYRKYRVERRDGKPLKGGQAIVLEVGDPKAWAAIATFAESVEAAGNPKLAADLRRLLAEIGSPYDISSELVAAEKAMTEYEQFEGAASAPAVHFAYAIACGVASAFEWLADSKICQAPSQWIDELFTEAGIRPKPEVPQ